MFPGIEIPIGANIESLRRALKDAEELVRQQKERIKQLERQKANDIEAIQRELADREAKLSLSGVEQRVRQRQQEANKTRDAILATVKDRKQAEALMAQNAALVEREILAIRQKAEDEALAAAREAQAKKIALERRHAAEAAAIARETEQRQRQALQDVGLIAGGIGGLGGGSLTLALAASVGQFREFEATLNQIKAVSGATGAEMKALAQQAQQLGADTQFSGTEAAQGMAELAKAGLNVQQTMGAVPGVLSLAAAGGLEVARAAEIAGAAVNGFGLEADQATYVADLLATAANASALDVSDVGESFKYVASAAASNSQSIEQIAALLAILGNAGIKGSQGGTVLRATLAALVKPTDDASKLLHGLGVSVQDTEGHMLPLTNIIGQLRERTAKLSEVQRTNAIATIFGTEAMSGILAIMKQTPAQVAAVEAQFRSVAGASKEMAATMNSGLKGSLEELGGAADTAGTSFGEKLAPAVKGTADAIKAGLDAFNGLPEGLKATIAGATVAGSAFLGLTSLLAGFVALAPALKATILVLSGLSGPIGAIAALSVGIGALVVAMNQMSEQSHESMGALKGEQAQVNALVKEYEALRAKTNATAAEKARMQEILAQIEKVAPGVISGYDGMGRAADISKAGLARFNGEIERQITLLGQVAEATRQKALADRDGARMALYASQQELKAIEAKLTAAKKSPPKPRINLGTGRNGEYTTGGALPDVNSVEYLQEQISLRRKLIESEAQAARQAAEAFERAYGVKPAAAPSKAGGSGTPGAIVPLAAKTAKASGTSPAEKSANDAVTGLREKYQELIDLNNKFGGGIAGQTALWSEFLAEVSKIGPFDSVKDAIKGTERTLRGLNADAKLAAKQRAAENAKAVEDETERQKRAQATLKREQRDRAIGNLDGITQERAQVEARYEDEIASIREAAAAEKKRIQENTALSAAQRAEFAGQVEEVSKLRETLAQIERDDALGKASDRWKDNLQDLTGELAAIAADPSLERFANLAKEAIGDPEKVKGWVSSLETFGEKAAEFFKDIETSIEMSGGGIEGILKTAQSLASTGWAAAAPFFAIASAAGGVAAAAHFLKNTWDAMQPPAWMATLKGLADDLSRIQNRVKAGIDTPDEGLAATVRVRQDNLDKLMAERDQMHEALMSGRVADPGYLADQDERVKEAKALLEADQKALDEATKKAQEKLERPKKLEQALDLHLQIEEGALDEAGNKISLEARKQLDLDKLREQHAQTMYQLEKQKTDLVRQQTDLASETATKIKDIENEGIAVRALTEFQDKAVRIAAVQEEADKKKSALKEQLEGPYGINQQIEAEERQYLNQQQYIKNTADARMQALANERTELTKNLGITLQQLDAMRQMASMNGGGGSTGSGSDGRIDGSKVTVGTMAPNMADGGKTMVRWDGYSWNRAATGGMVGGGVPGVDSVPILAQRGELIVDNPTTAALQGFLRNAQQDSSSPAPEGFFRNAMDGGRNAGLPASAMQMPGGGVNVNVGGIVVNPSKGMDERALAQAVQIQLGDIIRRSVGRN